MAETKQYEHPLKALQPPVSCFMQLIRQLLSPFRQLYALYADMRGRQKCLTPQRTVAPLHSRGTATRTVRYLAAWDSINKHDDWLKLVNAILLNDGCLFNILFSFIEILCNVISSAHAYDNATILELQVIIAEVFVLPRRQLCQEVLFIYGTLLISYHKYCL